MLSAKDAASRIGFSSMAITRWCEAGKRPAVLKPYGKKTTWLINPQAFELFHLVECLNKNKQQKTKPSRLWQDYQDAWINAMSKGILGGKVYSKRTIDDFAHSVVRSGE